MSLTAIQNKLHVPKGQKNSFGKYSYRSNEDIQQALKPLLEEFDATFFASSEVKEICGTAYIESTCILVIGKEKYISKAQAGIEKNGGMSLSQAYGSAISYSTKYASALLFGIDNEKDDDALNKHITGNASKNAPKEKVDHVKKLTEKCSSVELKFDDVARWALAEKKKDIKLDANAKALMSGLDKLLPEINAWLITNC